LHSISAKLSARQIPVGHSRTGWRPWIERELFEEARELMRLSELKKLPCHKGLETDLHFWKKASARHKTRTRMSYTIYRCPLWHQCKCIKTTSIRVGRGRGTSGILYTWYKAVQGGMYWYEPVRTLLDTRRYEKPQNGTYPYVLT
jgi:hypothetical protein